MRSRYWTLAQIQFNLLFTFLQVSSQEPEVDKAAPPPNPPAEEPGTGDQETDDPEITQNPSREFLKFTNQALQLNVRFITRSNVALSILLFTDEFV